ncbi:hypothetical protein LOTGIDRAFT_233093 [Lottia gigantea]|uniref:Transglutaminase-like domain-containing protein n=1 Tax=Lottia gigantea TaxID=225164 RepID=V4A7D4_LOTGI|nr:hypothetical protein LOTGIDRAFT_233093 [Lottia gigantea]ESO92662.1 hypothetical protein LOTGIDRAFT_233093 [Lottia gigantea]
MGVNVSKEQNRPPSKSSPSPASSLSNQPDDNNQNQNDTNNIKKQANGSASKDPKQYSKAPPPPRPPGKLKDEIFKVEDYKEVDEHALSVRPRLLKGTFLELVQFLTDKPEWDDLSKVRCLFMWMTSVDVYSFDIDEAPSQSPLEYFRKIQANTGNHAHLFSGLCQMAGIPCTIISGMNKSAAYEVGKPANRKTMGAQWNAVYCAGDWRFVDAFWASACVVGRKTGEWSLVDSDGNPMDEEEEEDEGETQHRINEFYFLTDPDKLIWTHFPDEKKWQLLPKPVSQKDFEDHCYIRERFYIMGMNFKEEALRKCLLKTQHGERDVKFTIPAENSCNYRFKYMLYQSRTCKGSEDNVKVFLDRFVFFEHTSDYVHFELRFPIKGDFKMDIYGLDLNESDTFDLCCTYIIHCPEAKKNCMPFPDCPPLGWGPIGDTKNVGLKPKTHNKGIVESKDGKVEIRFKTEKEIQLHQTLKHSVIDDATLSNYSVSRQENGEAVVNLRLPQKGEYALKLFAQDNDNEGEAPNVCNYLIRVDGTDPQSQPFPNMTKGNMGKSHLADKLGVKALTHPSGMIDAETGKLAIKFSAKKNLELVCELHCHDAGATKQCSAMTRDEKGEWIFDLDLPQSGEYSLNVFAREKKDASRIYDVHTYLIKSAGYGEQFKGKADDNSEDGDQAETIATETVDTSDKVVMIPVPPDCEKAVAAVHRKNANDPPGTDQIKFIKQDDSSMVKVDLPDYGEYVLNLYNVEKGGNVKNVAKYQINRKPAGELYDDNINYIMDNVMGDGSQVTSADSTPSPELDKIDPKKSEEERRKAARKQVQKAIDLKDVRQLQVALARYDALQTNKDDEMLKKAQKVLQVLKAKSELTEACQKRKLPALEEALRNAKAANFDRSLDLPIAIATRLRDRIAKMEKLRHEVLSMEQKTISEIKSYSKPPDGIHPTLTATFLLLGVQMKELKEWKSVIVLMGKTGKDSFMRQISYFDPKSVSPKTAARAKKVLNKFTRDQVRQSSAGAATFYIWVTGMIEEIESHGGTEAQSDSNRLRL